MPRRATLITVVLFVVADYLATVGTRFVVAQSYASLPLVAVNIGFWKYSVAKAKETPTWTFILAGVIGTWLGISFP